MATSSFRSPKEVLNSPAGKFFRAIASVFIATSAVAVWTSAKMAQIVTEGVRVAGLEWIKKVGTGQSELFNPNPALDTISSFFGSIGEKAISAGLFGFKQSAELMENALGTALIHTGYAKTTDGGNDDDLEDILATKRKLAEYSKQIRDTRLKAARNEQERKFLEDYLPDSAEWEKKLEEILDNVEATKNDENLDEDTKKQRLGEHSIDLISHILAADPLTRRYMENRDIEASLADEYERLFETGPNGEEIMRAGVTEETLAKAFERIQQKIGPNQSPQYPNGSELGPVRGRQPNT
jgi:hypothetical protein